VCPELETMPGRAGPLPAGVAKECWVLTAGLGFFPVAGLHDGCVQGACVVVVSTCPRHTHTHTRYEGGTVVYIGDPLESLGSIFSYVLMSPPSTRDSSGLVIQRKLSSHSREYFHTF